MPEELGWVSERFVRGGEGVPVANEPDVAASEVNLVVPVRCVQEHALVLIEAWDGGPRPVVQDA